MQQLNEFALIGLGKMGGNLARQALEKGMSVVGLDPGHVAEDLLQMGLKSTDDYNSFRTLLKPPRLVMLSVPAGQVVDLVLAGLKESLEPGDVVVDIGNSYWGDSRRRHQQLKEASIEFVDMGTSGGPEGARHGACFMCGGEGPVVGKVRPVFEKLAIDGGFVHAGPPGAGHFVKLVHNGIEFGMMQAIGEGLDLLESYDQEIHISDVLQTWRQGTVIRSWLIDLLAQGYRDQDGLKAIEGYVEDTGEVNWLVQDAAAMEVPIPVIAQSVWQLMLSRDQERIWAKAIAAMRSGFGGHPFGRNEAIARVRKTSRVSPAPIPPAIQ